MSGLKLRFKLFTQRLQAQIIMAMDTERAAKVVSTMHVEPAAETLLVGVHCTRAWLQKAVHLHARASSATSACRTH